MTAVTDPGRGHACSFARLNQARGYFMKKLFLALVAFASSFSAASAQDNALIDRHIAAASKAAKADLLGALGLCKTATPEDPVGFMDNYTKMKAEPPLE